MGILNLKRKNSQPFSYYLDIKPAAGSGELIIKGWIFERNFTDFELELSLAGKTAQRLQPNLARPDVCERFGGDERILYSGFEINLPVEPAAGRFELTAVSKKERQILWRSEEKSLEQSKQNGQLLDICRLYSSLIAAEQQAELAVLVISNSLSQEDFFSLKSIIAQLRERGISVVLLEDDKERGACIILDSLCLGLSSFSKLKNRKSKSLVIYPDTLKAYSANVVRYLSGAELVKVSLAEAERLLAQRNPKSLQEVNLLFGRGRTVVRAKGNNEVSVIIPVHNALDATASCLKSLQCCEGFKEFKVIIVDDASDACTTEFLKSFAAQHTNTEFVRLKANQGFLKACYAGLEKRGSTSDIILLNSDVVLSARTLKLLRQGAYSSENIAVASCLSTNSPNCQIEIPAGHSLESLANWIECNHQASYPTLITPEGQCLYLKRWALEEFGFFDEIYGQGFGEESDLCMRMYLGGADMICVDNALIFHRKSASFGDSRSEELKRSHWPIFEKRWGKYHRLMYQEFTERNPLASLRQEIAEQVVPPNVLEPIPAKHLYEDIKLEHDSSDTLKLLEDTEVVFILPNIHVGGGTLSVLQHVNEMLLRGINAKVISLWEPTQTNFHLLAPLISVAPQDLFRLDWGRQKVVATFWLTSYFVRDLCEKFPGLKGFYYVQGYEPMFYGKGQAQSSKQAEASYQLGLQTVVKSNFLREKLNKEQSVEARKITAGINKKVFYPGTQDQGKSAKRLTFYYRPSTPDRGASKVKAVIEQLLERAGDLEINLFGEQGAESKFRSTQIKSHGFLSQEQVAKLYRSSDIVFDLADFHGFGRQGIEAMCCGAVPILSDSGGVHEYAVNGQNSFIVTSVEQVVERATELINDRKKYRELRVQGLKTASEYSEEKAVDDWLELLRK